MGYPKVLQPSFFNIHILLLAEIIIRLVNITTQMTHGSILHPCVELLCRSNQSVDVP